MRDVTVAYTATDCDAVSCAMSVTSTEPASGTGDGDLAPDWEAVDATHVRLRAEHGVTGAGHLHGDADVHGRPWPRHGAPVPGRVGARHRHAADRNAGAARGRDRVLGRFWRRAGRHAPDHGTSTAARSPAASRARGADGGHSTAVRTFGAAGALPRADERDRWAERHELRHHPGRPSRAGGDLRSHRWLRRGRRLVPIAARRPAIESFRGGQGGVRLRVRLHRQRAQRALSPRHLPPVVPARRPRVQRRVDRRRFASVGQATPRGAGTITGDPRSIAYRIVMEDGLLSGGADRIRVMLTDATTSAVIYDTQPSDAIDAAPTLALGANGSTVLGYSGATPVAVAALDTPAAFALERIEPNPHGARRRCATRWARGARAAARVRPRGPLRRDARRRRAGRGRAQREARCGIADERRLLLRVRGVDAGWRRACTRRRESCSWRAERITFAADTRGDATPRTQGRARPCPRRCARGCASCSIPRAP